MENTANSSFLPFIPMKSDWVFHFGGTTSESVVTDESIYSPSYSRLSYYRHLRESALITYGLLLQKRTILARR